MSIQFEITEWGTEESSEEENAERVEGVDAKI